MQFKLLLVFVDKDKTDAVIDAARDAGATGATILSDARGQGLERRFGLFGLEVLSPRDVIMILVENRRSPSVLKAVEIAGQLDESLETGLALLIDVEQAVGLSRHIEVLAKEIPPA